MMLINLLNIKFLINFKKIMRLFFNRKKNLEKFNLVHCLPEYSHGPNGYKEVIDSVKWGLEQLGYEVCYSVNEFKHNYTNIVFGAQVLDIETLEMFPANTIIYNLEQIRGGSSSNQGVSPVARFKIWDYNAENLKTWERLNISAKLVPVGYAPILERIKKPEHQDIDVLIYGSPGDQRFKAFNVLAKANLTVMFVSGLYGKARDDLISRAKLVLNTHYLEKKVFEIVRVSYLLSNKKAVVAILETDTAIDSDIKSSIRCSSFETLVADCKELLGDDSLRTELENKGFNAFSCRDIREILENALT